MIGEESTLPVIIHRRKQMDQLRLLKKVFSLYSNIVHFLQGRNTAEITIYHMSSKSLVLLGMSIGSIIGGYIPSLFGADMFSVWGIVGTALGGFLGIYITYKLTN